MRGAISRLFCSAGVIAATAVASGQALAADLVMPMKAIPAVPAFSWAGFYGGVHLGYNLNDPGLVTSSTTTISGGALTISDAATSPPGSNTTGRLIGGAQVGANLQTGIWVYGVEADISAGRRSISNSALSSFNNLQPNTVLQTTSVGVVEDDWYGTVRARLGVARDHWLVYGSGGFAYGELKTTNTTTPLLFGPGLNSFPGAIPAVTASQIKTGWAAGAGAAYACSDAVSLFAEWTRIDLGSQSAATGTVFSVPGGTFSFQGRSDVDARFDVIQAGVNVKIN